MTEDTQNPIFSEERVEVLQQMSEEINVPEAVPISGIAPTPADVPTDYGNAAVVDFPDPAWGETDDDDDEYPDPDEPK